MEQQTLHSKKATSGNQTASKKAAKVAAVIQQEEQLIAPEDRHHMIAEAAYLVAERRGFQGEMALDDWLQAETEVDAQFAARH